MVHNLQKNEISLWGVQVTLVTVGLKAQASTITKLLYQLKLYDRCVKKKVLLSKNNIRVRLQFAIEHIDKYQAFWNIC